MNGLKYCSAKIDDKMGCIDPPCFLGTKMWKEAGGDIVFGGPQTLLLPGLEVYMNKTTDDDKCKDIETTVELPVAPVMTCTKVPTPRPLVETDSPATGSPVTGPAPTIAPTIRKAPPSEDHCLPLLQV
jgi:hypothetical protein